MLINRILGLFVAAVVICCLCGCGSDPMIPVYQQLDNREYESAKESLQDIVREGDEPVETHFLLFVICRHLESDAVGDEQQELLDKALAEFKWIVKKTGIDADYSDMEASLEEGAKTQKLFEEANVAVFGR